MAFHSGPKQDIIANFVHNYHRSSTLLLKKLLALMLSKLKSVLQAVPPSKKLVSSKRIFNLVVLPSNVVSQLRIPNVILLLILVLFRCTVIPLVQVFEWTALDTQVWRSHPTLIQ
jgi:hypothetical protein